MGGGAWMWAIETADIALLKSRVTLHGPSDCTSRATMLQYSSERHFALGLKGVFPDHDRIQHYWTMDCGSSRCWSNSVRYSQCVTFTAL